MVIDSSVGVMLSALVVCLLLLRVAIKRRRGFALALAIPHGTLAAFYVYWIINNTPSAIRAPYARNLLIVIFGMEALVLVLQWSLDRNRDHKA